MRERNSALTERAPYPQTDLLPTVGWGQKYATFRIREFGEKKLEYIVGVATI